jgi:pilus assembly protein CpaB
MGRSSRSVALLFGILTACSRPPSPPEVKLVSVIVAAVDLEPGAPLDLNVIAERKVDEKLVSKNHLVATDATAALTRKTLIKFLAGDMLMWSALDDIEPVQGLSTRVDAPGARGMWIEVTGPVAPNTFVRRGDLIDVVGVFRDPTNNESVGVTVVQAVKVLAAEAGRGKSVALLVTPDQAEKLQLAVDLGSLSITVRSAADSAVRDGGRATIESLLDLQPKKPKK